MLISMFIAIGTCEVYDSTSVQDAKMILPSYGVSSTLSYRIAMADGISVVVYKFLKINERGNFYGFYHGFTQLTSERTFKQL